MRVLMDAASTAFLPSPVGAAAVSADAHIECDQTAGGAGRRRYEQCQGGVAWRWPEQALAGDYRWSPSRSALRSSMTSTSR
jgi:hypothetical protein